MRAAHVRRLTWITTYSKRTMAADMVQVMAALGQTHWWPWA